MLSNKVCLVAALVGTLCPVSDGARAQEDLNLESAACHCACTISVSSPLLFQSRGNVVPGTSLITDEPEESDIAYYVEVRRLTQGFGSTSWSATRKCDHNFCNKDKADELCPKSIEPDTDASDAIKILKDNRVKLLEEAQEKMTPIMDEGRYGWSIRKILEGEQAPFILYTNDDAVVVAVNWVPLCCGKRTEIAKRMAGWPFKPLNAHQLSWGFQADLENLENPEKLLVQQLALPRGILVEQEFYNKLPAGK